LDTELLKTFLEVQKTRHFGKAADNLYLTQSAVSFRIRQLEQSLGVTLFNRFRNNIQLTTAGEMLLPHAQAVLSAIASAKQQIALNYHPDRPLQLALSTELSALFCNKQFNQLISAQQHCQLQLLSSDLLCRQSQLIQDGVVLLGSQLPEPQPMQMLCLGYLELVAVGAGKEQQTHEATLGLVNVPRIHQTAILFSCAESKLLLQWLVDNQASAYLPSIMVKDTLGQQLQRLPLPAIKIPVWAYSLADASWPELWRTCLQSNSVLLSSA
jgi:DNA-binding transcriptional LysR family regulator